jgi:FixJ family two-component response regulator
MMSDATVYVLDDDLSFVRSTERLLGSWGLHCESFTSPAAFLARDLSARPACLVLDLRMPGISGLEVQRALAATGRKLPVIFISGHADVQSSVEAMKLGAVDFFMKPIDETQLITAVHKAIKQDVQAGAEQRRAGNVREMLDRLAPDERRVCDLVVAGRRDDQIAQELGWTEEAVRASRMRAMAALSVASVVEFVRVLEAARGT